MALDWMLTTLGPYLMLKASSVSRETALRKGSESRTASMSPSRSLIFWPERSPPDCMEVCPPQTMMTLLPMPRKPMRTVFAEAAAVAEEQHDGDEAPDDAEHGEAGAQAVADERVDGLGEGFVEVHGE